MAVIVLTKVNIRDLKNTIHFIYELGINRIMLARFNIGGEGIKELSNILYTHDEIKNAFKIANQVADELMINITSNV